MQVFLEARRNHNKIGKYRGTIWGCNLKPHFCFAAAETRCHQLSQSGSVVKGQGNSFPLWGSGQRPNRFRKTKEKEKWLINMTFLFMLTFPTASRS